MRLTSDHDATERLDAALGRSRLDPISRTLARPARARADPDSRAARLDDLREGAAPDPPGPVWSVIGRARDVAARHTKVVALLGLAAILFTVWGVLRARTWTQADPIATPSWTAAAETPSPSAGPEPTPTPAPWFVHVLGAVHTPGLVEVPAGARVADAIAAAGGLTGDADPAELNLAAELTDGAQVIIGTLAAPRGEVRVGANGGGAVAAATAETLIDLNTATQAELETLPGVGPVTAQAILDWRAQHGRFTDLAELQEVDGIGPKTYAQIAPHVRI